VNYEEAKAHKQKLNEEVDKYSKILNSFEKGVMGLTPDHIRESAEYKEADSSFKIAFSNLRNFNEWYIKEFRKKKGK
jgi:hypothetical protein